MPEVPLDELVNALLHLVLPGLGAALLVMLAIRLIGGERSTPFAAGLAVAAGVLAANYLRQAMTWELENQRELTAREWTLALAWTLERSPPTENPGGEPIDAGFRMPETYYWLPWLAGLALLVELLARLPRVGSGVGWSARTLVAIFAGRLVTPDYLRVEMPWAPWALGGVMLLQWGLLSALARKWKDATVPAALALWVGVMGMLMLYVNSIRLMDMAVFFFPALAAVALVVWICPGDTGGAVAPTVIFLPGLLLTTQQTTFNTVPLASFLLMGLAPLMLVVMLWPSLARQVRWKRWLPAVMLPLLPALVAVVLAMLAPPLEG